MRVMLRPVAVDDLDALRALDADYAREHGVEVVVSPASLTFYARAGHAFAAVRGSTLVGGALAHAVWDGDCPRVRLVRLVGGADVRPALLEAVVKSAYDAAVYELVAEVPAADAVLAGLLAADWRERAVRRFERALGSRAAQGSA